MGDAPIFDWLEKFLDLIFEPQKWPRRLRKFSVLTFPVFYPLYCLFAVTVLILVILYAMLYVAFAKPIWFLKKMWMCPDVR